MPLPTGVLVPEQIVFEPSEQATDQRDALDADHRKRFASRAPDDEIRASVVGEVDWLADEEPTTGWRRVDSLVFELHLAKRMRGTVVSIGKLTPDESDGS